jgi:SAP domain.
MEEGSRLDVDSLNVEELKEELRKLDLRITGSKAVLRERLRSALCQDNDDDESASDGEDEQERQANDARGKADPASLAVSQTLSFKDVEDSLQTFSGDTKQNVRKWLEDFEETCEICCWTEAQKIVYAKKLLRGSAKLFVTYEKCAGSWRELRKSLIKEFS